MVGPGPLKPPSEAPTPVPRALSRELLDAGALLLDIGTNLGNIPGQLGYQVSAYPTCQEAAIVPFGQGSQGAKKKNYRRPADKIEDSRGRQAKTAVRRICRHNHLAQLVTFTYSEVPPLSMVSEHFHYFWKRWRQATGLPIPPYVMVCEWGSKSGRLHVHVGVDWWDQINAVEVCPKCDEYDVLEKFPRIVPANFICIGCLWGRGFVGRPEQNVDGRGMSGYLSKYIAKDMSGVNFDPRTGKKIDIDAAMRIPFGGKRYRASLGAKPQPVKVWAPELEIARAAAIEIAGNGRWPAFSWLSNDDDSCEVFDVEFHDFLEEAS